MTTYAIGDIQGCYAELRQLLQLINFDPQHDCLWFVGDLVNRGPDSLQVLRYVKALPNKIVVLGNHDFHLLALHNNVDPLQKNHTLDAVLAAPDCLELIEWLRHQPLLHHDQETDFIITHAGIYPGWDLAAAKQYAHEVETSLQSDGYVDLLAHMYGNKPDIWDEELTGFARLRFIINSFVRMRFCNLNWQLDFMEAGPPHKAPAGYMPWFKIPTRKTKSHKLIFGHWAALMGQTNEPDVYALDAGCVWGGQLMALRVEDGKRFAVACAA